MGRQGGDQNQLFYLFNLERRILACHLLRQANSLVTGIGRPAGEAGSLLSRHWPALDRSQAHDPMLIVGCFYGIRFERRPCEEVELHLAHRWFCRLDLDDKVPDHSTFSVNRRGRFRDSDILRHMFEAMVRACMEAG